MRGSITCSGDGYTDGPKVKDAQGQWENAGHGRAETAGAVAPKGAVAGRSGLRSGCLWAF